MFIGGKLLTTALPGQDEDAQLLADLGMRPMTAALDLSPVQ
jgi:biotin synthase